MGLETATFISELVDTNPVNTDKKRQGDDHLRLIKAVAQSTFPNADKAFYFPTMEAKTANFSVVAADMNKTFLVSTGVGEVTATLPSLTADDDGWVCHFIKTNTGTNALFIAPAAGTLQSGEVTGLANCRRVIPGHRCSAMWDGTAWYVTRVPNVPVGTVLDFCGSALPVGYEWPNGQTLANASTKYREFYSINGNSGVTFDICGRVVAGKDDMGEASNNRLTVAGSGIDGDTLGASGGEETHTLTDAEMATTPVTVNVSESPHTHGAGGGFSKFWMSNDPTTAAGINTAGVGTQYGHTANTGSASTGITASGVIAGSDDPHNNVQPTIVLNKILVVE